MTPQEEQEIRDAGREPVDLDELSLSDDDVWASLSRLADEDPLLARFLDGDR